MVTNDEAGLRKTETIYDNASLRITVKKDLYDHGDGKLEVTTQYDQLGRPVLARSLEPDNADGIKVKSAYYPQFNRIVQSSPYRTLSDPTLEWTCTQSKHRKHKECGNGNYSGNVAEAFICWSEVEAPAATGRIRVGVFVLLRRILKCSVECPDVSGQVIPHKALRIRACRETPKSVRWHGT